FKESKANGELNNLQKLVKIFVQQLQELDDVNQQLLLERSLDTSVGTQLNGLGEILGLERYDGEDDSDYRERLKFQSFINSADGTPEVAINVLKVITDASKVWYNEYYPAAYQMATNGQALPNPAEQLIDLIQSVSPAGVQYVPITVIDPESPFVFSADPLLDLLAVVPDENNLLDQYNVEVDTGELIEVQAGQFPNPTLGGYFSEAIWTNEPTLPIIYDFNNDGAGRLSEVIQKDGSHAPLA